MKIRTPKTGEFKVAPIIDSAMMRGLDEGGFIEKVFATRRQATGIYRGDGLKRIWS